MISSWPMHLLHRHSNPSPLHAIYNMNGWAWITGNDYLNSRLSLYSESAARLLFLTWRDTNRAPKLSFIAHSTKRVDRQSKSIQTGNSRACIINFPAIPSFLQDLITDREVMCPWGSRETSSSLQTTRCDCINSSCVYHYIFAST